MGTFVSDPGPNIPTGRYRVIGIDTFPWPHEEYFIGVYPDLGSAKAAAQKERQSMTAIDIYDDSGKLIAHANDAGQNW